MGAPNLTNGIWLYGGTEEQIAHTLRVSAATGQMPAFGNSWARTRSISSPPISTA
jgi:cytochrome c oxidase cbb3-type subunit 3